MKLEGSRLMGFIVICLSIVSACGGGSDSVPTSIPGYSIGGTVTNLSGTGLVLQNNGDNNLNITADGSFTFASKLESGVTYTVTIAVQPSGESCTVNNGTGSMSGTDITNVAVVCDANPTGYYDLGTLSVAGGTITDSNLLAMISGNRIMMTSLASNNTGTTATLVYDGIMTITGNDFTADVTVYTNGENPVTSSMTGTITEGSQITNGTLAGTGVGSGSFDLMHSDTNSEAAVISRITTNINNTRWSGTLNGAGTPHTFEVDVNKNYISDGITDNDDTFEFCAIDGTIKPIDSTSLYSVNVTLFGCTIDAVELSYSGFAATTSLADTKLVYMATESTKTYSVGGEYD